MTSYNRVNGLHVAEDPWLLRDILRKEFELEDGLVISDWSGTYSSSDAIKASLDLEMPGPAYVRGVCVERDIVGGKLKPSDVDECVRRVCGYNLILIKADIARCSNLCDTLKSLVSRSKPRKEPSIPQKSTLYSEKLPTPVLSCSRTMLKYFPLPLHLV
jgi:hypothetical protein